jgi:DNA-binding HxlR family transcriptional regulator
MSIGSPPHTLRHGAGVPDRETWHDVNAHCAIARTLGVISTRTAFLLLREAFYGATRFEQFTRRAEVSEPVAAARLRELTEAGLLEKVPYREPGQRTRSAYQLTDQGADLLPALAALWDWGDRWTEGRETRIGFAHTGCGAPVHAALVCEQGHQVPAEEIEISRRSGARGTAA